MKYFRVDSMPLEEVFFDDLDIGDIAFDSFGREKRKKIVNGRSYMVEEGESPLVAGELLENLTDRQLDLFWKIVKKR